MTTLAVLQLLLSFCSDVEFKYMCRYDMRTCFERNIERKISTEKAFRECLDEHYETYVYDSE